MERHYFTRRSGRVSNLCRSTLSQARTESYAEHCRRCIRRSACGSLRAGSDPYWRLFLNCFRLPRGTVGHLRPTPRAGNNRVGRRKPRRPRCSNPKSQPRCSVCRRYTRIGRGASEPLCGRSAYLQFCPPTIHWPIGKNLNGVIYTTKRSLLAEISARTRNPRLSCSISG